MPSRVRPGAGMAPMSWPRNSIVPEVCGHVARDDVEQRRLPRAVGAEDGAPLAVRDVEVDVAHGIEAAEPPADPPQAEDRAGRLGGDVLHVFATR